MNCANARANFSAYVEHELSEQERRQTAAHLGRCPSCSRDLFAMQKAMSLIRWVPRADARPGFEDRLYARLRSEREVTPASRWWPRFAEFGVGLRQLWAESWAPAPAMAVAVAALLGTGSGAYITHHMLSKQQLATMAERPAVHGAATTIGAPAIPPMQAPLAGSIRTPNGALEPVTGTAATASTTPLGPGAATEMASAAPSSPSAADVAAARSERTTAGTVRAGSPATRPAGAAPMTVASASARRPRHDRSAGPGDRMEVAPWAANNGQPIEGPPSVSQVEYILNLVDVNQERVLQLPATAVVSGSTVTF